MEVFIVSLRSALEDFDETVAIVVAENAAKAIKAAKDDCSFPVADEDIECELLCEDEPCVIWLA